MDEREAIAEAKRLATQYNIKNVLTHGKERTELRNASSGDIRAAILSCTHATYNDTKDTWRFEGGTDLEGDPLDIVLAFGVGIARVVTVMDSRWLPP